MRSSGARRHRILGLLLYLAFSPAGIEVAHAASHALHGDLHRQTHGVARHLILPEGASAVNRQEAESRLDPVAAASAPAIVARTENPPHAPCPPLLPASDAYARGPSRERAPPA